MLSIAVADGRKQVVLYLCPGAGLPLDGEAAP